MKSKPFSLSRQALLAAVLAGGGLLAATSCAAVNEARADKPRCEARVGQQAEAVHHAKRAAHLAALKDKLQLSAGQESAWDAFVQSMQPGPHHGGMDRKATREEFASLNTPERLDRMRAMAGQRQARMAARAEAVKAFYAQLSPEQQKVFDAEAMSHRQQGEHHRQHRHPHA
jgi:hypothetical protein